MAKFTITNLTANPVHLGEFYTSVLPGVPLVLDDRKVTEIPTLRTVQAAVAAGTISFTVEYTTAEINSGLLAPPASVGADDIAPVAATAVAAPVQALLKTFAAGPGGTDDVVVFAANALPYKMRVLFAELLVSAGVGASSCVLRDEAAGAGAALMTFDTAAPGAKTDATRTVAATLTPGATKGLFLRRSDSGVAGTLLVYVRREV